MHAVGPSPNEKQYWAKGTGFGTGSTSSSWDMSAIKAQQQSEELLVSTCFAILAEWINISTDERGEQNDKKKEVMSMKRPEKKEEARRVAEVVKEEGLMKEKEEKGLVSEKEEESLVNEEEEDLMKDKEEEGLMKQKEEESLVNKKEKEGLLKEKEEESLVNENEEDSKIHAEEEVKKKETEINEEKQGIMTEKGNIVITREENKDSKETTVEEKVIPEGLREKEEEWLIISDNGDYVIENSDKSNMNEQESELGTEQQIGIESEYRNELEALQPSVLSTLSDSGLLPAMASYLTNDSGMCIHTCNVNDIVGG